MNILDTTILPSELWEIIAEDWRIWRKLQQCNRHLATIMSRVDPYRKYTIKEIGKAPVYWGNKNIITWRAGNDIIKRVVSTPYGGLMESYRGGHNYLYSDRGKFYYYSTLEACALYQKFIYNDCMGIFLHELEKEERDAIYAKYQMQRK